MAIDSNVYLSFSWRGPYSYKEEPVSRIDLKIGDAFNEVWAQVESSLLTSSSQPLKFAVKAQGNSRASLRLREEFACSLAVANAIQLTLKCSDEEINIPIRKRIPLKEGNKYLIQIINSSKGLIAGMKRNEILSLSDDSSSEEKA